MVQKKFLQNYDPLGEHIVYKHRSKKRGRTTSWKETTLHQIRIVEASYAEFSEDLVLEMGGRGHSQVLLFETHDSVAFRCTFIPVVMKIQIPMRMGMISYEEAIRGGSFTGLRGVRRGWVFYWCRDMGDM